jgi:hypothetical protein
MLSEVFHLGKHSDYGIVVTDGAMWSGKWGPTCQMNILPPSSGQKQAKLGN